MRLCRKLVAVAAAGLLLAGADAFAEKKPQDKGKDGERTPSAKKKREKKSEPKPVENPDATGRPKLTLPVPPGHDSKGLKIPYFDTEGKLQMTFTIGVASRLDDDRVQMADLQLETFDAKGETEMTIELPRSVLDLQTRVLSTETAVTIRRADFEITGQTMEFNTETRQGKLGGNVRMLIYNADSERTAAADTTAPETP